jgi:multidrug resistance efflux pump
MTKMRGGRSRSGRPLWSTAAAILVALTLIACSTNSDRYQYSGTVQAESAAVGSTIGGRVVAVDVQDGAEVKQGEVIVRFDARQTTADLDAAVAQARQAEATLADLEAGPRVQDIDKAAAAAAQADAAYQSAALSLPQQDAAASQAVREAVSDLRAARATAADTQADYLRARTLCGQGAISSQAMDAARAAARVAANEAGAAAARLRAARANLNAVHAGSASEQVVAAQRAAAAADANLALVKAGTRPDQVAQARAAVDAAAAEVAGARARLDEAAVTAPQAGIVDGLDLHPGDLVPVGAAVATIDEFDDPWVRIYVDQPDLARFKVGTHVDVRSDAQPGQTFSGHVELIDATAEFTPRDVETASDRADLSFGVKIRIHDPQRILRGGTTVEVGLP